MIWKDTKRVLGMPISFTKYELSEDRLFMRYGVLTRKEEQISLYHIRDMSVSVSLFQRLFGVGTISVVGVDKTTPRLDIVNIKNPYKVRDLLYKQVQEEAEKRNLRHTEIMDMDSDLEG